MGSSNFRKDEYNWRYDDDLSKDVIRASSALENIHLDRKARNLTSSWRYVWLSTFLSNNLEQSLCIRTPHTRGKGGNGTSSL